MGKGRHNMKKILLIIFTVVVFICTGCASKGNNKAKAPQKPHDQIVREHYFKISPELSEDQKQKIFQKNIFVGMTPTEVRLCWPEPDYKSRVNRGSTQFWSYEVRYQTPKKLTFENGKLAKIENTKKNSLVKYGSKQQTYNQPIYGLKASAKAETTKMAYRFVDALFDNNRLVKNPFKTIKKYEDILIKRGLKLEYEEENKTIIIRPVKNDRETLASKALQDIIPGLPNKNITYLKIPATKLAFLLSGYQANYAAKCRENTSDDKIKEYEVVLNWYYSTLKKPEIFKITVCNELIEEDGIYKPVRVINSSEIKSNEKFYFLTD